MVYLGQLTRVDQATDATDDIFANVDFSANANTDALSLPGLTCLVKRDPKSESDEDEEMAELARKPMADMQMTPSVWFVNFPQQSTVDQQEKLQAYMQKVEDFNCLASVVWWRSVYNHPKIPQDSSPESTAVRSAYFAKLAMKYLQETPW